MKMDYRPEGDGEMAKEIWKKVLFVGILLTIIFFLARQKYPNSSVILKIPLLEDYGKSQPWPRAETTERTLEGSTPHYSDKINHSDLVDITFTDNTTGREFEELFIRYSESKEVACKHSERMGKAGEGGWEMCIDPAFLPKQPCLIYSFGINNEWHFDDACDLKYACTLRAFDPSMKVTNHKRGKKILFYAEGLAGSDKFTEDKLWRLSTLHTIRKTFNETDAVLDYLKIDIEYWEWESLQAAIEQGALKNVKQLGVEVHRDELTAKPSTIEHYRFFFKVFQGLRDEGFYKWSWHLNPYSITAISPFSNNKIMCCYEFIFLNAKYL